MGEPTVLAKQSCASSLLPTKNKWQIRKSLGYEKSANPRMEATLISYLITSIVIFRKRSQFLGVSLAHFEKLC